MKYSNQDDDASLLRHPAPEAICIVNLARLTDTPSLLPAALYMCSRLGDRLFDGWKHEDGTVEYLSHEDIRLCFKAQLPLAQRSMKVLGNICASTSDECPYPEICTKFLTRTFVDAARDIQDTVTLDALLGPKCCYGFHLDIDCEKCSDLCEEIELSSRKKTWMWLPKLFGLQLDGWGQGLE